MFLAPSRRPQESRLTSSSSTASSTLRGSLHPHIGLIATTFEPPQVLYQRCHEAMPPPSGHSYITTRRHVLPAMLLVLWLTGGADGVGLTVAVVLTHPTATGSSRILCTDTLTDTSTTQNVIIIIIIISRSGINPASCLPWSKTSTKKKRKQRIGFPKSTFFFVLTFVCFIFLFKNKIYRNTVFLPSDSFY